MFFLALFYRILSAAVGLRTGAGKIWRKHANSKLSILVLPNYFPRWKIPNLVFVWFINRTCWLWRFWQRARDRMVTWPVLLFGRRGRVRSCRFLRVILIFDQLIECFDDLSKPGIRIYSQAHRGVEVFQNSQRWRNEYHNAVSLDWCF